MSVVMAVAKGTRTTGSRNGVWIYVDNSNVWIEGKKLASRLSNFNTYEDPRLRIDIGELTSAVAANRPIVETNIYGSRPPKADSLWKRMEDLGFKVHIHDRSRKTGKEKMVDTQMSVHITRTAGKKSPELGSAFIVVSGDADHIPAIKVAMEEHWKVEVHMWQHAISGLLRKLSGIKVCNLDEHRESITFISWKVDIQKVSRYESYAVICSMSSKVCEVMSGLRDKVQKISRWPFQYWIKSDYEIILVFKKEMRSLASSKEKVPFDIKKFLTNANGNLPGVTKVEEYDIPMHTIHRTRMFNQALTGIERYDHVLVKQRLGLIWYPACQYRILC